MPVDARASIAALRISERSILKFQSYVKGWNGQAAAHIGAWRFPASRYWEVLLKHRLAVLIVFHMWLFAIIYWLCYVIRFDGAIPAADVEVLIVTMPLIVALKMAILLATGSHRGLWRQFT